MSWVLGWLARGVALNRGKVAVGALVAIGLPMGAFVYVYLTNTQNDEELFNSQADINRRVLRNTARLDVAAVKLDRRSKQNRTKVTRLNRIILGTPGKAGIAGQSIQGPAGITGLSVTGPGGEPGAGIQGPQGVSGAPGSPGGNGEDGSTGTPGTNGAPGSNGVQGAKGDTGDTGAQGPEPDLTGRTFTCTPTADPLDPPTTQTCTLDP